MKKFLILLVGVLIIFAFNYEYVINTADKLINQLFIGQARAIYEDIEPEPGEQQPREDTENEQNNTEPVEEQQEPYLERTVYLDDEENKVVNNPEEIMVLVNKERNLPSNYIPSNLVKPDIPFPFEEDVPKKYVRQEAARSLEQLVTKAAEEGMDLYGLSGYRSYETQKAIFEYKARNRGEEEANKTSARPGQSEHQTGLAMDVTCPQVNYGLVERFSDTPEGKWLEDNAADFGFILRYPKGKEHITGYSYEPWHLRYVGEDIAQEITNKGITLEEYLEEE